MSSSPHSSSYSDALAEGSTVDRYTIQRMLGKGGFGITYLVSETSSDQANLLALKESIPEHLVVRTPGDQTLHVRTGKQDAYAYATGTFLAEAQTLSQLDHPHIIKVHRAFEQNHTVYFTMDYLEGGSLADEDKKRLKHNTQSEQPDKPRWSESEIIALLTPLLDALEYLHAKDILHRDIKPDNILLSSQGQPVLADFGAAKLNISEHTHAQTIVGTAGYTPIEQRGQQGNNTGAWSDLYALGATCYYLMTGKPPVMAEDRVNQKRDPHIPLTKRADMAHYSHALRSSIDRALLFDHERRWQTASAWRKQLHAIESKQQHPRSSKLPWIITLLTLSASVTSYLHHRDQISSLQAQLTVEITRNQTTRERIEKLSEKYSRKPAPPSVSLPSVAVAAPVPPLASPWSYPQEASYAWIAPQGDFIALRSADKKTISLYSRLTKEKIATIAHNNHVRHLAFSADGKLIATASIDQLVNIFDIQKNQTIATIQNEGYTNHLDLSPDGKFLAIASDDKTAKIFDIQQQQLTVSLAHVGFVFQVAFSPNGKFLATTSDDLTAKVFDIQEKNLIASFPHDSTVYHAAFSPDSKLLATGSRDKSAKIFDIQQKELIKTFSHNDSVRHVAFSPDGKYLVTHHNHHWWPVYSDKNSIRLYNVQTQRLIDTIYHDNDVVDVAFPPQAKQLLRATTKELLYSPID